MFDFGFGLNALVSCDNSTMIWMNAQSSCQDEFSSWTSGHFSFYRQSHNIRWMESSGSFPPLYIRSHLRMQYVFYILHMQVYFFHNFTIFFFFGLPLLQTRIVCCCYTIRIREATTQRAKDESREKADNKDEHRCCFDTEILYISFVFDGWETWKTGWQGCQGKSCHLVALLIKHISSFDVWGLTLHTRWDTHGNSHACMSTYTQTLRHTATSSLVKYTSNKSKYTRSLTVQNFF